MNRSLSVGLAVTLFAVGCGRAGQGPESPSAISPIAPGGSSSAGLVVPWSTFSAGGAGHAGIFSGTVGASPFGTRAQLGPGPQAIVAPGTPGTLTSSASGSTVTLIWSAPTGGDPPTSYVVEAGSSPGGTNLANFDTGTTGTTLIVTAVPVGTYYVRVRGRNSVGLGAASNEVVVVVTGVPCAPPGAPSGLVVVVDGSTVTLTWSGIAGVPAYVIEAGSSPGLSNLANFETPSPSTSFTAFGVGNGSFYVRVKSRSSCGTSGASNEVLVTVAVIAPRLTGQWLGLAPDGIFVPTAVCEREFDVLLDLTQTGSALTGTGTLRVRTSTGGLNCAKVGDIISNSLTGTVATDGSFAIRLTVPDGFADLSGSSTATRMGGAITFRVRDTYSGTWSANRR
jgi:hypothetical protein